MLFNLVKKDLILAKKYLIIMIIFAIGAPVFIETKTNFISGGFLGFLITALWIQYMLFNAVSMSEDKSKGSVLLCATPYTRKTLVKAKYLFILVIFACTCILYAVTSLYAPIDIPMLNISTSGISLLIIMTFFGIIIPLQYQFGYEKTKNISMLFVFISPFVFPKIVMLLKSSNISFQNMIFSSNLFSYFLTLVIGFLSMIISIHIYSKKSL